MVYLACCVLDTGLGQTAYANTVKTIAEARVMISRAGPDSARPTNMPECLRSGHLRHNETLRRVGELRGALGGCGAHFPRADTEPIWQRRCTIPGAS